MSVAVDPLASLRAWATVATLGEREYRLRPALAAEWLPILMESPIDAASILPGMLIEADEDRLELDLVEGRVTEAELIEAAREVISLAAGREWWWACNLLASTTSVWMIIFGAVVSRGVDVERLPLGAVLDALYSEFASRMDKPHLQDFDRQLNTAPAGVVPTIDEDREAMNFVALMNSGV